MVRRHTRLTPRAHWSTLPRKLPGALQQPLPAAGRRWCQVERVERQTSGTGSQNLRIRIRCPLTGTDATL